MNKVSNTPENQIQFHQNQMDACELSFVEHAYEAGVILKQQKERLSHGEWLDWLADNWTRKRRTAQEYMLLATLPKSDVVKCESIRQAQKLLPDRNSNAQRAAHLEPRTDANPPTDQGKLESEVKSDDLETSVLGVQPSEPGGSDPGDVNESGKTLTLEPEPVKEPEEKLPDCPLCKGSGHWEPATEFPQVLMDSEEFMSAWARWVVYRVEKRQKLTKSSTAMQLKNCAKVGPAVAVAAIDKSISNGWTGIFIEVDKGANVDDLAELIRAEGAKCG